MTGTVTHLSKHRNRAGTCLCWMMLATILLETQVGLSQLHRLQQHAVRLRKPAWQLLQQGSARNPAAIAVAPMLGWLAQGPALCCSQRT